MRTADAFDSSCEMFPNGNMMTGSSGFEKSLRQFNNLDPVLYGNAHPLDVGLLRNILGSKEVKLN